MKSQTHQYYEVTPLGHIPISDLFWSPDGERMAVIGWLSGINIYSKNFEYLQTLQGNIDFVSDIVWSSDSETIICATRRDRIKTIADDDHYYTLRVWAVVTGQALVTLYETYSIGISAVDCSPDGTTIVGGIADHTLRIWDIKGNLLQILNEHKHGVSLVKFSPNGTYFVSMDYGREIKLWRLGDEKSIYSYQGPVSMSRKAIVWSPDSLQVMLPAFDGKYNVWDIQTQKTLFFLEDIQTPLKPPEWNPQKTHIAGIQKKGLVVIWAADGRLLYKPEVPLYVNSIAWHSDGQQLAIVGRSGGIVIWHIPEQKITAELQNPVAEITSVTWSPDSSRLAGISSKHTIQLWDTSNTDPIPIVQTPYKPECQTSRCIAISPDITYIAEGCDNGVIWVWNAETKASTEISHVSKSRVSSLDWSPSGHLLASGHSDESIHIIDTNIFDSTASFQMSKRIWEIEWETDQLLTVYMEDSVVEINIETSNIQMISDQRFAMKSPDGQMVAQISYEKDILYKAILSVLKNDLSIAKYGISEDEWRVNCFTWSSDSRQLALACSDGKIRIWDLTSEQMAQIITPHSGGIEHIIWHPNDMKLATNGQECAVCIWNTESGRLLDMFYHDSTVIKIRWSQNGDRIASASLSGFVQVRQIAE